MWIPMWNISYHSNPKKKVLVLALWKTAAVERYYTPSKLVAREPVQKKKRASLLVPIPRLARPCSVWSAATACRCRGAGAAPHVHLKAKINLPVLGTAILPLCPGPLGNLLTINKHRCAIIMGLPTQISRRAFPPQYVSSKNIADGPRRNTDPAVECGYII